jgi:hypothetical protein
VYSHGPYGECIAESYGGGNSADAVRLWIAESVFYNIIGNVIIQCYDYGRLFVPLWLEPAEVLFLTDLIRLRSFVSVLSLVL